MNNVENLIEKIEEVTGLRKDIDYQFGKPVNGNLGTYYPVLDIEDKQMLKGYGLWMIKNDGEVYAVDIPRDDEIWDDFSSSSQEEQQGMDLLGVGD